jgi:hypothetical protein
MTASQRQLSMSDPHDTAPRRSDLPRRFDLESPSSGGSMWPWLARSSPSQLFSDWLSDMRTSSPFCSIKSME